MRLPDPQASRAVLIGTSEYEHLTHLPAVTRNLHTLSQELIRHEVWGLPPQHCEVVEAPQASPQMIDPVRQAADEARDVLLVYFAGHGIRGTNGELYFALPGTPDDRSRDFYWAVRFDDLRRTVRDSRALRRVVILDCCFSGMAIDTMGAGDVVTDIDGTYTITSAPPTESALAPDGAEFTAFTNELIKVMQNGIPEGNKLLTLDEIFYHIKGEMEANALPIPWHQDRNDAGKLTLFRNRAAEAHNAPPGYGEIPGIEVGRLFPDRRALYDARVHRQLQAGIVGRQANGGAESIVISGGYPDDEDYGDVIIYTGHGGQDKNGHQEKDQEPTDPGNAALLTSITTRYPVRAIRGAGGDERYSPAAGYTYDGLYRVEEYWATTGMDGFRILQFRLEKIDELVPPRVPTESPSDKTGIDIHRWEPVARGVYQDRRIADKVKQAHNYECQVCEIALQTPAGFRFAQTFHLRSLARPHRGPDIPENIVCLCPTHRVQFELGTITVDDDLQVIDQVTGERFERLRVNAKHQVGLEYLRYHRDLYRR